MNFSILRQLLIKTSVVWFVRFTAGCTSVVRPLSTSDLISPDKNHGLVLGQVQLAWHGSRMTPRRTQLLNMKWSLEEETQRTYVALADLPTASPFVVRLPAGSYQVKGISFTDIWGTWHTVSPTTFQVKAGGCTSLGTWKLQRETESFADRITGYVFKDLDETHVELRQILAPQDCVDSVESPVRSRLGFRTRGGGNVCPRFGPAVV